MSLAGARERRDAARKMLARGVDSGLAKRLNKAAEGKAAENIFEAVAREWFAKHLHRWSEGHSETIIARLVAQGRTRLADYTAGPALRYPELPHSLGMAALPGLQPGSRNRCKPPSRIVLLPIMGCQAVSMRAATLPACGRAQAGGAALLAGAPMDPPGSRSHPERALTACRAARCRRSGDCIKAVEYRPVVVDRPSAGH